VTHWEASVLHCNYIHKLQRTIFICYTQHMKLDCVTARDDAVYPYVLWMGHAEPETEPSVWFPLSDCQCLQWMLISVQKCKDHIWKMCMPLEYIWLLAKSHKETDWKKFVIPHVIYNGQTHTSGTRHFCAIDKLKGMPFPRWISVLNNKLYLKQLVHWHNKNIIILYIGLCRVASLMVM
jgi:hypothetical protein